MRAFRVIVLQSPILGCRAFCNFAIPDAPTSMATYRCLFPIHRHAGFSKAQPPPLAHIPFRRDCARLATYRRYPKIGRYRFAAAPYLQDCRLPDICIFARLEIYHFYPKSKSHGNFPYAPFRSTALLTISPLTNLAPNSASVGYLYTVLARWPVYRFTFLPFSRARWFAAVPA